MSYMDEKHRYRPYYRHNRRYDDDYKQQYKKPTKQHYYQYPSASRREQQRNYHDSSYRRSHKNDYHYPSTKSKSYSYFSSPPPPLMSTPIVTPLLPPPPPPPAPAPSSVTIVPHERESWIRSVKRTKMNESTEQKTQYLETMLRMPQQKSSLNLSKFDRMRFSDKHLSTASTITTSSSDNLDNSSFHLIDNIHTNEEIRTFEKILFDNEVPQRKSPHHQSMPTPPQSVNESEPIISRVCSGFLIDNCDEEEELPSGSPPPQTSFPPLSEDLVETHDENINEERVMLVSELDAADAERKQELKRQKRLHKKLQKKTKEQSTEANQQQPQQQQQEESLPDWVVEYDRDQVLKLRDEIRRTSITMTNEDKTEKVNLILMKIKKQQEELRKLKQYVISMLDEEERPKSTKTTKRTNSNLTQDLLLSLFNPPTTSGCWLCSGKMYSEVATQCQREDQSDKQ